MHELIKRFISIIEQTTGNIALLYDTDPDGISSGVIIAKTLAKLNKTIIFPLPSSRNDPLNEDYIQQLKEKNVQTVISVDNSLEKFKEGLKKIAEFASIIILDHHKVYDNPAEENILLIKSQFIKPDVDPSQYCTAKLTYDICQHLINIDDLDWLSCIGIIGDSNYKTYKDFVDRTLIKYGIIHNSEIFNTTLGQIATLISYAQSDSSHNPAEIYETVLNSNTPEEILKSPLKKFESVGKELRKLMEDMPRLSETFNDMVIYEISPKYKLGSIISTISSHNKYPDNTVIIITDLNDGKLHISARRQDGSKPMNTLLEKATANCENSNAGGHIPASGATIMKKDKTLFLKQLKEISQTI